MVTEQQSKRKLILNSKLSSQCQMLGFIVLLGIHSAEPRSVQRSNSSCLIVPLNHRYVALVPYLLEVYSSN